MTGQVVGVTAYLTKDVWVWCAPDREKHRLPKDCLVVAVSDHGWYRVLRLDNGKIYHFSHHELWWSAEAV